MRGKADAHAHVTEGVLEDQVPADDPGHQLAKRRVGVGVSRARNRDHGRQLRIAEPSQRADDRHQNKRDRQRGTSAGTSGNCSVMQQQIDDRRVCPEDSDAGLPPIATPMTVKMPDPMTAPMPSAVNDTGPSVFFNACSGLSDSEISLSIDFVAKICLASALAPAYRRIGAGRFQLHIAISECYTSCRYPEVSSLQTTAQQE